MYKQVSNTIVQVPEDKVHVAMHGTEGVAGF